MTDPAPAPAPTIDPAAERVVLMYDPPSAGPLRAVLLALFRHLLTGLGVALVAHGWTDAAGAKAAVSAIAEELVGALLVAAGTTGAAIRANLSHSRWADAWAVLSGQADVARPAPLGTPVEAVIPVLPLLLLPLTLAGCGPVASAGTAAVRADAALTRIETDYAAARALVDLFLPMLPPDRRLHVIAAGAAIEQALALARSTTDRATRAAALAEAADEIARFRRLTGG